jgi:hypothetical protein
MALAAAINFPFERGKEYRLAELNDFEEEVLSARRANEPLSKEQRAPKLLASEIKRLIKLRNDELIIVFYYARHKRMPDDTMFMLMPERCKIDVRLTNSGKIENLQITIAYPEWVFPEPDSIKPSGYQQRLSMEILNRDGCGGWGPITMNAQTLSQDRRAVSTPELLDSHRAGLVDALRSKFLKDYGDNEIIPLVNARAYHEGLALERFRTIAHDTLCEATLGAPNEKGRFQSIYIFGSGEDYFLRTETNGLGIMRVVSHIAS